VHEIRMIQGNVAALSEPAMTGIVPPRVVPIVRSLPMSGEGLSARHGELFRMLLKAGEHSEVALLQYRAAILWMLPAHARYSYSVPPCCAMAAPERRSDRADHDDKDTVFIETFAPRWRC
jgi:hypothetical protein